MDYKLTDGNREPQYINEKNDCTVRALAVFLGVPYYQAHDLMAWGGRKSRHKAKRRVIDHVLTTLGYKRQLIFPRLTVNQFIKENPKGIYLVFKKGHVFTIKESIVFDSWKVRKQSKLYWYFNQ